ncbi:MAG: hemerythrin domain-containing protein [Rhodospirillales bacterium]
MSEIIAQLRDDHRNLARLLDLMAREIRRFETGERPDYELIESILEYVINFPDIFHHPLEDAVLARLKERDPETIEEIGDLHIEHEKLGRLTRRFAAAVRNVMQDETLPRDWFVGVASDYLSFQRNHMQMEEVVFFPAAFKTLTDSDWKEISNIQKRDSDPVFESESPVDKFHRLREEILNWEN